MDNKPTTEDLHAAMTNFLLVFGANMPRQIALKMAAELRDLGQRVEDGGDKSAGRLTKVFGQCLAHYHPPAEH